MKKQKLHGLSLAKLKTAIAVVASAAGLTMTLSAPVHAQASPCDTMQCPNGTYCSLFNGRATCFRESLKRPATTATRSYSNTSTTTTNAVNPTTGSSLAGTRSGSIEFFRPTGTAAKPCPDGSQYLRNRGVCMRRIGAGDRGAAAAIRPEITRGTTTTTTVQPVAERPTLRAETQQVEPVVAFPEPTLEYGQCRTGYTFNPTTNRCAVDRDAVMRVYCARIGKQYINFQCR